MENVKKKCSQVQQQNSQAALPSKSSGVSEDHHHLLKLFIQKYHNLPVLWDASVKDYNNKGKRSDAYKELLIIYKLLKPNATLSDVKKKINNLRTNYRRMLKDICVALKSGAEYQPGWTFYELDFLRSAENFLAINMSKRKRKKKSISSSNKDCTQFEDARQFLDNALNIYLGDKDNASSTNVTELSHQSLGNQNNNSEQMMEVEETDGSTPPLSVPESLQNNVESSNANQSEASVQLVNTYFPSPRDDMPNVECKYLLSTYPEEESTARSWTYKLKRLPKEQRLLAEKYIKDILYEAESGTLYRGCMELHASPPFVRLGQSQTKYITHDTPQNTNAISTTTSSTRPIEVSCPSPIDEKYIVTNGCLTRK